MGEPQKRKVKEKKIAEGGALELSCGAERDLRKLGIRKDNVHDMAG